MPQTVASPRNEKKPITSVVVVTNTADETAGSTPAFSSVTGTNMPARPATRLLISMERSEEHTSELQSLMRISYAVFCLNKKKKTTTRLTYITKQILIHHILTTITKNT